MSTNLPALIKDGYTRSAYISEREGLHPAVSIEYRPMTYLARESLAVSIEVKTVKDIPAAMAKLVDAIVNRVTKWDVRDPDTKELARIEPATVQILHPIIIQRLSGIIQGYDPGDLHPNQKESPKEEIDLEHQAQLNAQINGTTVDAERQKLEAKN